MSTSKERKGLGIVAVLFTALLWSTSGIGIKLISWNPAAIAGTRSLIAALVLLAVTRKWKPPRSFAGWAAAFFSAMTMLTFVIANKLTTSANAVFLQYLSPAFVAVLSIPFLKEYSKLSDWLILFGVLCGMVLFFLDRIGPGRTLGNIISVVSGLCMAMFIIFMRMDATREPADRPVVHNMIFGHIVAAVVCLPWMVTSGLPNPQGILELLYLGAVQIGLSALFFAYGVKRLTAVAVSIITLIEPVLNPVWVYLVIGERPSIYALIGGAVILILVGLRSLLSLRRSGPAVTSGAESGTPLGNTQT